jgi:hypothetical protein
MVGSGGPKMGARNGCLHKKFGGGGAEAERIRKRVPNTQRAGLVRHVIEVAARVGYVQVDRRRRDLVFHRERRDARLETAGRAEEMAGHRFRRRHRQLVRVFAEE